MSEVQREEKALNHDPLSDTDRILSEDFYGRTTTMRAADHSSPTPPKRKRAKKEKPTHYKVICISLYTKDIENLTETVAELKRRGHTKANKSQLIRIALSQLDIDKIPPPQP